MDMAGISRLEGKPAPGGKPESVVPLLRGRPQVDGRATAYACRRFTCLPPVTQPSELEALLE